MALGVDGSKIQVVGNGVDTSKFQPVAKTRARRQFGISAEAKVLISVGGLVERKGFHRVIECLPGLRQHIPDLHYLIVGGASGEGDWTQRLKQQVKDLSLEDNVHFLGIMPPSDLKIPLSAADIFVLATRNEGWANVFLEAMACGLPVITTDVGGNREVICSDDLGTITPFGNKEQLQKAILNALSKIWDRCAIINYAKQNSWNNRVDIIVSRFCSFF
jgi:glycosyltransferase involved in cell wall biosynthesis